jgi:flagellar motor component MotA
MVYSKFSSWVVIVGFTALCAVVANHLGFFKYVYANDPTKLSFLIIGLFICSSIVAGWQCAVRINSDNVIGKLWWCTQALVTLGMIGTVIGFLLMLSNAFASIDLSDIESTQAALTDIGIGMATALLTTFFGMTGGLLLQVQLLVAED